MAIVKMNRISIVGLEVDKDSIIESLMKLGVVEITHVDYEESEEGWSQLIVQDGSGAEVTRIENEIAKVESCIEYLSKYDKRKKGLFEPKRSLSLNQYNNIISSKEKIWDAVEKVAGLVGRLSSLQAEENRLNNMIDSLTPWKPLTIPVEITSTKSTIVAMGVLPSIADPYALKKDLYKQVEESYLEVINGDKDQHYLLVIYYRDCEEEAMKVLKQYGFARVSFNELKGTIEQNILALSTEINNIRKERKHVEKSISELATEKENIEVLHDYLVMQRDKKKILGNMIKTGKVFLMEGWVPEKYVQKVKIVVERKWDCILDFREPKEDEEFPVLLDNPRVVQPFELVTELYSLPNSREIDPNRFMAPFYFIFFGLMIGDAGYGLVMAIVTGIVLLKFKLEGLAYKLIKLLFFGGISTFLWGVLFGGWFGDIVDAVTNGKYTIKPLWFNPLDDPMRLLVWAFIFGAIHLYVGMGLQAYKLIKDGRPLDALFDVGFWYILLTGLALLIVGGSAAVIGKYMSIVGAILLVLTQGRSEKNILKKLVSGVLSLYNVTGYLSDVLSYSRLLALGLATGVIANVINTMGTLFGMNVPGIIVLIVAFIVGHTFNILVNVLGAFVHASRLQYVEFFGKFFEGGGKEFKPLKANTKYITVEDKEAI
ncbi:MAG: V-type ATP synthase subunit I [Clostridiaceae bacterium]|nr:V-type ATP synthase subunit I [Clostridiaceae bacterium]